MTAVEWLEEKLKLSIPEEMKVLRGLVVIALEMEKEQIIDAYNDGINDEWLGKNTTPEQYYNKTYKKKTNDT